MKQRKNLEGSQNPYKKLDASPKTSCHEAPKTRLEKEYSNEFSKKNYKTSSQSKDERNRFEELNKNEKNIDKETHNKNKKNRNK